MNNVWCALNFTLSIAFAFWYMRRDTHKEKGSTFEIEYKQGG